VNQRKQKGLTKWALLGVITTMFGMFSPEAKAVEVSYKQLDVAFHGYFEVNWILRDTTGWQDEFMYPTEGIQQRNTLKFDLDIHPGWELGPFSLDKIHMTYRGAYDSIFDIRSDRYRNIREKGGPSKFDFGKIDIRLENDLREVFFDVVYTGALGSGFVRPGRQLISWGEVIGVTIIDVINPPDNSFQLFFLNPDDLKQPLWMIRTNYSLPPMKFLYLNVDFLAIPEIRPLQLAPLDQSMDAPYASITPFAALPEAGVKLIRYEVPTNNWAFGVKVTGDIGPNLSVSAVYLKHLGGTPGLVLQNLGLDFSDPNLFVPQEALLSFFMTETVGGFFNYYFQPLDIIVQGEIGRTNNVPVALPILSPDLEFGDDSPIPGLVPSKITTFRMKPVTKWMLGFAKDLRWRWFSAANIVWGVQWIHTRYGEWEELFNESPIAKDTDLFVTMFQWWWFHSKIQPSIIFMAETTENFMSQTSVLWTINKNWYAKVAGQAFWGKEGTKSQFALTLDTSELTFKVGFQW
jgi:hypothetical protein